MVDYSFEDLAASAGQNTGDFFKDFANGVADSVCSLYRSYPGAFSGDPLGLFPAAGRFTRGIWDSLCGPRPGGLPLPPPPPSFVGAQCDGVLYEFNATAGFTGSENGVGVQITAYGPVRRVYFDTDSTGDYVAFECRGIYAGGNPNTGLRPLGVYRSGLSQFAGTFDRVAIRSVVRIDGGPDNCGDPPSQGYPLPPPGVIPPSIFIPVPYPNGQSDAPSIRVDLPDFNQFNFPVTFKVDLGNPEFNFNFDIDVGGVSFGSPGAGDDGAGDSYEYPDWFPRFFTPPNPDLDPDVESRDGPVGAGPPPQQDKEGLKWVRVELTKFPDKAQFAPSGNNVYFGGWIAFRKGIDTLPRQQINFASSLFRVPDGADGYEVVYTNGAEGKITEYVDKEEGNA